MGVPFTQSLIMFKKLTIAAIASLSIFAPNVVSANTIEDHQYLWDTIPTIGAKRYINHPEWCSKMNEYSGLYDADQNVLVICPR